MEIKELSLEEKYDKLYDQYIITDVIAMAFIKENGLTDEYLDYTMKIYKKMMPSIMGYAFKFIKTLSPARANSNRNKNLGSSFKTPPDNKIKILTSRCFCYM